MRRDLARAALAGMLLVSGAAAVAQDKDAGMSQTQTPSRTAKGTFEVRLQPLAFEGAEPAWQLGRLSIDKDIAGDLVATTRGQMLSALTGTKGSAGYVAIERVTGTLDGRHGSFVLQHTGLMNRGTPTLSVVVVPDSGTDELAGLEGDFRILVEGGQHRYEFTYRLPAGDTP